MSEDKSYKDHISEMHMRSAAIAEVPPAFLEYWAFPKVYPTTAGPFGGVGGCSSTTFTIECFANESVAVYFCQGKFLKSKKLERSNPIVEFK